MILGALGVPRFSRLGGSPGPWSPCWNAPPVAGALRPSDNLACRVVPPVAGALRLPDNLSWRVASFALLWAFASTRVVSPGGGIVTWPPRLRDCHVTGVVESRSSRRLAGQRDCHVTAAVDSTFPRLLHRSRVWPLRPSRLASSPLAPGSHTVLRLPIAPPRRPALGAPRGPQSAPIAEPRAAQSAPNGGSRGSSDLRRSLARRGASRPCNRGPRAPCSSAWVSSPRQIRGATPRR